MSSISASLAATAFVISLGPLQYGFHLAELNAPQDIITCHAWDGYGNRPDYDCIPMGPSDIGTVTGIFAIGGLIGASVAGTIADYIGRRRASIVNAMILTFGSLITAISTSVPLICIGRTISGLGAGSAIVVGPLYVSEIAPAEVRGTLGFASQIAINIGILIAQVAGYFLSNKKQWRIILGLGSALGIVNGICLIPCRDAPTKYSYGYEPVPDPGVQETAQEQRVHQDRNALSVKQLLSTKALRAQLISVVGIMAIQQLSGINSIIFFGVEFLKRAVPNYSRLVNVFISVLNLIVTCLVAPQVDKHGRRSLLLVSIAGMSASALILVVSMGPAPTVSAVSAITFVISFAIGLGPIPFLIISELVPANAAGAAQSIGTTANWLSAFVVGYLFPILESQLGAPVFLIFVVTGILAFTFVWFRIPS